MEPLALAITLSLLSTSAYAVAIYLSFYLVKRINFPSSLSPLTPLLGLVLVLILTPFVFSPLDFIFGKLVDPLLNPQSGTLHFLEGLGLLGVLLFAYRMLAR